ncbi:hypothetical protein [Burkholderia glumae]|uniref:hypothetical protein n=1 Tax=Burkholderia glumae TaxID=337 RepID=UPI0003AA7D8C|nr:hypothetical protein [Burkholderia glumae]MCM2544888.1 hypothetical protein [Burkholderia glumae]
MSATNDFLAFGGGASPNVIDQATYAALPARLSGFQSGVAQSAQLNKVWRQSSIMAAVLAQFIVARSGQAAVDDGTTATLLSNLLASAAALNGDATQTFAVAAATAANQAVALSQAQAMRGTYNGSYSFNASATLTSAQAGSIIYLFGSAASQTLTLPAASSLSPGQGYTISNFATVPVTVMCSEGGSGTDTILAGTGTSSVTLQPGDDLEITVANDSQWIAAGSSIRQFEPLVVGAATATNHAATMAQATGVVGSARNLTMNIAAAGTSGSMTADEIIVETALGGIRYCLANFSQSIDLATVGAGGMDTGAAPACGYVALYAIYDPVTGACALLASNATSAVAPSVYGGANMPAGYTASALVSVWPTDSSGRLVAAFQVDRSVSIANQPVLSTSTTASSPTYLSIAAVVPKNARKVSGSIQAATNEPSNVNVFVYETASSKVGLQGLSFSSSSSSSVFSIGFRDLSITIPQVIFYSAASSASGSSCYIDVCGYWI